MNRNTPFTVCMFSNLYPPAYTGSSTQCAQLASELTRQGWKVIVITPQFNLHSKTHEVVDGVTIYRLPAIRLPRLPIALNFPWLNLTFTRSNQRRIVEILQHHPPDLIHLHNHMFDIAFHAVRIARRLKKPLVITVHTIIKHPNRFYDLLLRPADRILLKYTVIRQADMLICPDRIIKEYVTRAFGAERTALIPYGILPLPDPDPEKMLALREKHGLREGPVILSLGHAHVIRNRKELIEMLPQLLMQYPNLKVLIVGDVGTKSIEAYAKKIGVRDQLIFIGPVPHSEVSEYLGIADIEATWFDRSHPHKSLGIAAREAMAAGKVVVSVASQDIYGEGILQDGENVVLVRLSNLAEMKNRFIEILGNQALRRAIGDRASQAIREHFSWKKICEQTIRVYQELIQLRTGI